MKNFLLIIVLLAAALAAGVGLGRWWTPQTAPDAPVTTRAERQVLYWKAPMDPNFRRDAPGKSPMGMDLVPVYADETAADDPGVVSISPTVVNNLGVRTARAEMGVLPRRIDTVGYVNYSEDTWHQINTRVDGWIEKLAVKATGDPISRGQVLFELYSPTLVNAQEEYLAALQSRNTLLHQASRKRLASLGVSAAEIKRLENKRVVNERMRVYARTDGVVAHLGVREGMYIMPATKVMAIAALDQVWLLAEVFERQASWVRVGQRAHIEFDAFPGESRSGIVDYVYPELDAKTRTLKVRLRLANDDNALRPNMFARVTILSEDAAPMVNIPRQALIRGGRIDRVVIALGDGKFRAREVAVGMESGQRIEIRSGIAAGERVVTSGQFLIDSESSIDSALSRMNEPNMTSAPAAAAGAQPQDKQPTVDHSAHQQMGDTAGTDHSQHDMRETPPAMDHSAHEQMSDAPGTDHSEHDMGETPPAMDHGAHEQMNDTPGTDHSQHDMSETPPAMDHGAHQQMNDTPRLDHSQHDMTEKDTAMDHSDHTQEATE